MDLSSLILYGAINLLMVLKYLKGPDRFYQFPFWAGVIALGWFFPQAIGGYYNVRIFPGDSYSNALIFASLCTLGLWKGYEWSVKKNIKPYSWLMKTFEWNKVYVAGVMLSLFGFYFYWKLWQFPEEDLESTQWSGTTVMFLFLANTFKFGFLILWLRSLTGKSILDKKSLPFLIPAFLFLFSAVVLRGRRAEMMNLVSYIIVGVFLIRNIKIRKIFIISSLVAGLILVNGIGTYRSIMKNKNLSLTERISSAYNADYSTSFNNNISESGNEFKNYVYRFFAHQELFYFDYGAYHWNRFIFNYVPAQIVGQDVKEAFMIPLKDMRIVQRQVSGSSWQVGTTSTGYSDSFGSFGWFGFIKFILVGVMMGYLYRYARNGSFLAILLYVAFLGTAMHTITHGTNEILVRAWVYFFVLIYPVLYLSRTRYRYLKV